MVCFFLMVKKCRAKLCPITRFHNPDLVRWLFHLVIRTCRKVRYAYICAMKYLLVFILFLLTEGGVTAQEPPPNTLGTRVEQLKQGLETGDQRTLANTYEQLADDYTARGNYPKAEVYYKKSEALWLALQLNDDAARVTRKLAQTQEQLKNITDAIKNFNRAANNISKSDNLPQQQLNFNDVSRLNTADFSARHSILMNSVRNSQQNGSPEESANAYFQLGNLQLQEKNYVQATENFNAALVEADKSQLSLQVANQITDAYAEKGLLNEAAAVQQQLLASDKVQQDPIAQIAQYQKLASILTRQQQETGAELLLKKSYELAIRQNRTLDARNCLDQLADLYLKQGQTERVIQLYQQFSTRLDSLVLADSSLFFYQLLADTEAKIGRLESEKALKDQLLERQHRFNSQLLVAALLLLGLLVVLLKGWYAIRLNNKKIALQSLRREMNPHFVFNSLNSINQFIAQNNELEANRFLSSYAQLMRHFMENSNRDFVKLSDEIAMLQQYLSLELMRFPDKFSFEITIADDIDPDADVFPNMLIQPHLENAIWHGLRYKSEKGHLLLSFSRHQRQICARIEDDGIGIAQSKALKTAHQKNYTSRGLNNTAERIQLLNDIYGKKIICQITEKTLPQTGTIIEIIA